MHQKTCGKDTPLYSEACANNPDCPAFTHLHLCNGYQCDSKCVLKDHLVKRENTRHPLVLHAVTFKPVVTVNSKTKEPFVSYQINPMSAASPFRFYAEQVSHLRHDYNWPEDTHISNPEPTNMRQYFEHPYVPRDFKMPGGVTIGDLPVPAYRVQSLGHPLSHLHLEDERQWPAVDKLVRTLQEYRDRGERPIADRDKVFSVGWDPTKSVDYRIKTPKEKPLEQIDTESGIGSQLSDLLGGTTPESTTPEAEATTEAKPRAKREPKTSYVHVEDNFIAAPPCRFCDDTPYVNGKSNVEQTGTATDGRPLYAHPECDDPFGFANNFKVLDPTQMLECPNCKCEVAQPGLCHMCTQLQPNPVDVDFAPVHAFNSRTALAPGHSNFNYVLKNHIENELHGLSAAQNPTVESQFAPGYEGLREPVVRPQITHVYNVNPHGIEKAHPLH